MECIDLKITPYPYPSACSNDLSNEKLIVSNCSILKYSHVENISSFYEKHFSFVRTYQLTARHVALLMVEIRKFSFCGNIYIYYQYITLGRRNLNWSWIVDESRVANLVEIVRNIGNKDFRFFDNNFVINDDCQLKPWEQKFDNWQRMKKLSKSEVTAFL